MKKLLIRLKNLFFRTQYCEKCSFDLKDVPVNGFNQMGHFGTGERKHCPKCGAVLFL